MGGSVSQWAGGCASQLLGVGVSFIQLVLGLAVGRSIGGRLGRWVDGFVGGWVSQLIGEWVSQLIGG